MVSGSDFLIIPIVNLKIVIGACTIFAPELTFAAWCDLLASIVGRGV